MEVSAKFVAHDWLIVILGIVDSFERWRCILSKQAGSVDFAEVVIRAMFRQRIGPDDQNDIGIIAGGVVYVSLPLS